MKKTIAFGLPAAAATGAAGVAIFAGTGHHSPWLMFVWTSLIALLFLLGCISVVILHAFRWLWPLGAGFVTQTVGVILLATDVLRKPWETVWWTLGVVGGVLIVMVVWWITVTIRAQWLEKNMIRGVRGASGGDDLAKIRENMADALEKLRRAGGRGAIYELPWFLVIGRKGVGKTVAIKNSGLGLPSRKDWVKGVGGTITLNFFFTNDLIFLDTPGEWVEHGAEPQEQQQWLETLRLIRKYRGRRPLDGIVATVSADDLLSLSDEGLRDNALRVREVIDLLYAETHFRFPIYLLVTKCDLVDGFVEFFSSLAAQRKNEILGSSFEDPESVDPRKDVPKAFGKMIRRLERFRLEGLARLVGSERARRLFFFVEELRRIERPLTIFTSELFGGDRFSDAPVFRGFYLTSGTQGEGMPLSQAMSDLIRGLGVKTTSKPMDGEKEPERSYFLKDLFRQVMVADEGLVGRTAVHWWRERRNTFWVAFLPATFALIVLGMASLSFGVNRIAFRSAATEVKAAVAKLDDMKAGSDGESVGKALEQTRHLLDAHEKITRWSLLRTWGMRQPQPMSDETLQFFRSRFAGKVLDPTLTEANRIISDPASSDCAEKMRVLGAVVYLRRGHRWEGSERDLGGFESVWGVKKANDEREEILGQFRSILEEIGDDPDARAQLLSGFDLKAAASHVAESCGSSAALTAMARFVSFQSDCQSAGNDDEYQDCYRRLGEVITWVPADYEALSTAHRQLTDDLETLKEENTDGAGDALKKLNNLDLSKPESGECPKQFQTKVVPAISALVSYDPLIELCRQKAQNGGKFTAYKEFFDGHKSEFEKHKLLLQKEAEAFEGSCKAKLKDIQNLNGDLVWNVAQAHWRIGCLGSNKPPPPPPPPPGEKRPPPTTDHKYEVKSPLKWLNQIRVANRYTQSKWQGRRHDWELQLKSMDGIGLNETQKAEELQAIRAEISGYAKDYTEFWQNYLRSLKVNPRPENMALSSWLAELATSPEYDTVFKDAKAALQIQETTDPYSAMATGLGSMTKFAAYLDENLGQYRQNLQAVAADIAHCETDPKFRQQYSSAIDSKKLGEGLNWVTGHSGPEGVLAGLLRAPLETTKSWFGGTDVLGPTWNDVVSAYPALEGSMFFVGWDGNKLPDELTLTELSGGATGLVGQVRQAVATGATLSSEAKAWIEQSTRLSRLLFAKGKDELRPINLMVTVDSCTVDNPKLQDDVVMCELKLFLGTGSEFNWKEGLPRSSGQLPVYLVGEKRYPQSYLQARISLKKAKFAGMGSKSVELPFFTEVGGVAAPLKLLAKGREDGRIGGLESGQLLEFKWPIVEKGKSKGNLIVKLRLEGEDLNPLIAFHNDGLPPPPPTAK